VVGSGSALAPVVAVGVSACPEEVSDGKVSCASPKTTKEDLHRISATRFYENTTYEIVS
jgi:hypothetical protein